MKNNMKKRIGTVVLAALVCALIMPNTTYAANKLSLTHIITEG